MSSCILFKKDILELGKELMIDLYEHLHDEYLLTFNEVKEVRDYWDNNLVDHFLKMIKKEKYSDDFEFHHLNKIKLKDLFDTDKNILLELIEKVIINKKYFNDTDDLLKFMSNFMSNIKLEYEIDEDLFSDVKKFLCWYDVFYYHPC